MLGLTRPLYFPNIVFTGQTHKNKRIYILNWEAKDNACFIKHSKWVVDNWPDQNLPFMPSLPQDIDTWIINMKFAITTPYREEICRNSRRCLEEWNIKRSFDTNIREFCLETAEAHAFVAFYLLADCAYDTVNQCYYRNSNDDKFLIKYALAYKFWAHQTGSGVVRQNARLDELEKYACHDDFVVSAFDDIAKRSKAAEEFLGEIDALEKGWEKMSPSISEEEAKGGNNETC